MRLSRILLLPVLQYLVCGKVSPCTLHISPEDPYMGGPYPVEPAQGHEDGRHENPLPLGVPVLTQEGGLGGVDLGGRWSQIYDLDDVVVTDEQLQLLRAPGRHDLPQEVWMVHKGPDVHREPLREPESPVDS